MWNKQKCPVQKTVIEGKDSKERKYKEHVCVDDMLEKMDEMKKKIKGKQ